MLAQRRRRWPIITSALGQCIVFSGKWPFWRRGIEGVTIIAMRQYVPVNTGQSPNAISMSGHRRRLWFNIETALGE